MDRRQYLHATVGSCLWLTSPGMGREAVGAEDELAIGCGWKSCSNYHIKDSRLGGRHCLSKEVVRVYIPKVT
jgi:hypothetical protein